LKDNNSLGKLLLFVIGHEQGDLTTLPSNISIAEINNAYLASTEWVRSAESAL